MTTTTYENSDFSRSPEGSPRGQGFGHGRHGGGCGWGRGPGRGGRFAGPGADGRGQGFGRAPRGFDHPDHWPFPAKALAVLAGFAIFPPLGLLGLGYFIWRARSRRWDWQGWDQPHADARPHRHRRGHGPGAGTGNAAFEVRRREVLEQIEAERRKLDEEAQAFAEFRGREREARDQATYDRFMADKAKRGDEPPAA